MKSNNYNFRYKINKGNLTINERIKSNGDISVVKASDMRYYIYNENTNRFEYPSDDENSVVEMYYDIINQ